MAYLTPDTPPLSSFVCRRLVIPNSIDWLALVGGALASLIYLDSWEEFGTMTREEAAQAAKQIFLSYTEEIGNCMIGSIVPFATSSLPPHVLPCDGSIYNRTDFPMLYDLIDASLIIDADQFRTPDLRGRFVLASGNGTGLTSRPNMSTGGEETVTLSTDQIPAHSHTSIPHSHTNSPHQHGYVGVTANIDLEDVGVPDILAAGVQPFSVTDLASIAIDLETVEIENTGGGEAHNNMPPYFALTYGIVAK